jgi:Glycine zipper
MQAEPEQHEVGLHRSLAPQFLDVEQGLPQVAGSPQKIPPSVSSKHAHPGLQSWRLPHVEAALHVCGDRVGSVVGKLVGSFVGNLVGASVGSLVGFFVGCLVGCFFRHLMPFIGRHFFTRLVRDARACWEASDSGSAITTASSSPPS